MTSKTVIFDYQTYIKDENLEKIKFKPAETRNNNIFIPIKYHHNKYIPLLFKTPRIYMPFKPHISNELGGYIRLAFDNIKIDHKLKEFYDFINKMEELLEHKLYENGILKKGKYTLKKTIKHSTGFADYFNINFNNSDTKIYNNNLELINIKDVNGNFYAIFVIELNGFYCNTKTKHIRLIWNLLQFKLEKSKNIIDECLFLDESIINGNDLSSLDISPKKSNPLKNHPILEKYFKMLSVGIPKMAVQHKMKLSNIDSSFLDYTPDYNIDDLSKELLNKLSYNVDTLQNTNIPLKIDLTPVPPMMNILAGLNGIKLKKPSDNIDSNKKITNRTLPVPSLKEIQEAYQKLKKNIDTCESEI